MVPHYNAVQHSWPCVLLIFFFVCVCVQFCILSLQRTNVHWVLRPDRFIANLLHVVCTEFVLLAKFSLSVYRNLVVQKGIKNQPTTTHDFVPHSEKDTCTKAIGKRRTRAEETAAYSNFFVLKSNKV